jgi:hypothetical protein
MRKKITIFFFLFIATGFSKNSLARDGFQNIKAREPSFSQILKAYLKRQDFTTTNLKKWERKIKMAPFFPTLYAGYDHQLRETEALSVNDNISVSGGTVTIGPEDNDWDLANNQGQVFRVRAVWQLSDAIFNRDLFALSQERRALSKICQEAEADLYKIFEERHLYLAQYLMQASGQSKKSQLYYTKYLLLTERLDALTGRRFSKLWWRNKRALSFSKGE